MGDAELLVELGRRRDDLGPVDSGVGVDALLRVDHAVDGLQHQPVDVDLGDAVAVQQRARGHLAAVPRLGDVGVDGAVLGQALDGRVAQRLRQARPLGEAPGQLGVGVAVLGVGEHLGPAGVLGVPLGLAGVLPAVEVGQGPAGGGGRRRPRGGGVGLGGVALGVALVEQLVLQRGGLVELLVGDRGLRCGHRGLLGRVVHDDAFSLPGLWVRGPGGTRAPAR